MRAPLLRALNVAFYPMALCPNNKRGEIDLLPINLKPIFGRPASYDDSLWLHINRIKSAWRPMKDNFRNIRLRSICKSCQKKLNDIARIWEEASEDVEEEADARRLIRKKVRDDMAYCEAYTALLDIFAIKSMEYQWRREVRISKSDPFQKFLDDVKCLCKCEMQYIVFIKKNKKNTIFSCIIQVLSPPPPLPHRTEIKMHSTF